MRALSAIQTSILHIAHLVRIPAPEHLVHECIIVALVVARAAMFEPVPILTKDLFEDVPGLQSIGSHQATSLRGVRLCVIERFYHILPPTSTPVLSPRSGPVPHVLLPWAVRP